MNTRYKTDVYPIHEQLSRTYSNKLKASGKPLAACDGGGDFSSMYLSVSSGSIVETDGCSSSDSACVLQSLGFDSGFESSSLKNSQSFNSVSSARSLKNQHTSLGICPDFEDDQKNLHEQFDNLKINTETESKPQANVGKTPQQQRRLSNQRPEITPSSNTTDILGRVTERTVAKEHPRASGSQHVILDNETDSDGDTLLHHLILANREDLAIYLIENFDINVNAQNRFRQTALHLAVLRQMSCLMCLLLQHGASQLLRDNRGNLPLHLACAKGSLESVIILAQDLSNSGCNRLPNVELRNSEGFTCLHLAVMNNDIQVVTYLLHYLSAQIDTAEGKSGKSALHLSAERGAMEIVNYLVEKSYASVFVQTYDGRTALDLAEDYGQRHVADYLRKIVDNESSMDYR